MQWLIQKALSAFDGDYLGENQSFYKRNSNKRMRCSPSKYTQYLDVFTSAIAANSKASKPSKLPMIELCNQKNRISENFKIFQKRDL